MLYPGAAVEQAMRMQEVICRAISGQVHWFQAAEILGVSVRTMSRWKTYYEKWGYDGLLDRRRRTWTGRSASGTARGGSVGTKARGHRPKERRGKRPGRLREGRPVHPAGAVENAQIAFPTAPWTAPTTRRPQTAQALLRISCQKKQENYEVHKTGQITCYRH